MKRFLTPLPIGIVLADLIYGFVLNVMQGLNLQQTASNQSGTLSVTPDIAFNSLQIVANGGMVCIIGFGLIVFSNSTAPFCADKSCPSVFSEPSACWLFWHSAFRLCGNGCMPLCRCFPAAMF